MKCKWCTGSYDPRLVDEHYATFKHRAWFRVVQFVGMWMRG